jgi:recombination protein RecR
MNASFSPLIQNLINAFRVLPGVGPKSAQRMALYLLQHNKEGGTALSAALNNSIACIRHCGTCRNLCETEQCDFCTNPKRDASTLCIVESPADIFAIEQTGHYRGRYFVLMGQLSPLDGIGPYELGLGLLEERFSTGEIKEVILATSATVEGQTTAHYIAEMAKKQQIKTSQIAQGIPLGGELEYVDNNTIALAFSQRKTLE